MFIYPRCTVHWVAQPVNAVLPAAMAVLPGSPACGAYCAFAPRCAIQHAYINKQTLFIVVVLKAITNYYPFINLIVAVWPQNGLTPSLSKGEGVVVYPQ
jgi:hypothetical protein